MPEEIDPTRHMVSISEWEERPEGGYARVPIPLGVEAASLQASIDAGRAVEADLDNDWRDGVVAVSRSRGGVMGVLLKELAARLKPGVAVGPIEADQALSTLAADLASKLDVERTSSGSGD